MPAVREADGVRARLRSLRWRLLAVTIAAVALALVVTGVFLASLFREHVTAQFDAQLLRQLDQITAALEPGAQQRPTLRAEPGDPRWQTPYSGLYWQIEAADGARSTNDVPLLRSRSLWDTALQLPSDRPGDGVVHRHRVAGPGGHDVVVLARVVHFVQHDDPASRGQPFTWRVLVAGRAQELDDAIARFAGQLALYLAVLGLALLAAAWLQVSLGLRPLRQLQAAVQSIRQGRSRRLQGRFPAEVDPLVQDFNRVLDQNQQVVRRARQMAGNLAHAIKTPLAVLAGLADTRTVGESTTLGRQVQEQVDSIRRQVDWHLRRARTASAGVPGLRTAVPPVLEGLVRVMRKVHASRDDRPGPAIEIVCSDAALSFAGEAQDLQEMVGNLLDNACKWAARRVQVDAVGTEAVVRITVDDDGPGLEPARREEVFERGFRADERVPGTGLGLDIVREVAGLYHGELALETSPLGGLRASLRLPRG